MCVCVFGDWRCAEDNGRARAYNQTGDSNRVVEEAIDTCPVNCIYYTTFEDLVILEKEREGQHIKYAKTSSCPCPCRHSV